MYKLKKLFLNKDRRAVVTEDGETLYIEGELEQWLIVTVPPSTSVSMSEMVRDKMAKATDLPVMVLTDNIDFLVPQRISPIKAAKLIREYEKDASKKSNSEKEIFVSDDGDRSRVGKDWSSRFDENSGEVPKGDENSGDRNVGGRGASDPKGEGDDFRGADESAKEKPTEEKEKT